MWSTNQAGTGKLPLLVQVASLLSSVFIRGRSGLKRLENSQSKACTGFLQPLTFNPERSLGVSCGSQPADTRGHHLRWWTGSQQNCHRRGSVLEGRLQQPGRCCIRAAAATVRVGHYFRSWSAVWRVLPPPCFRPYTPPSRSCPPSAPLGPSCCKAKCGMGILQPTRPYPRQKPGPSQAQLSYQPSQPSLSLGSPISSGARVPAAPVPHGLLNPSGPATRGLGWQTRPQRGVCE